MLFIFVLFLASLAKSSSVKRDTTDGDTLDLVLLEENGFSEEGSGYNEEKQLKTIFWKKGEMESTTTAFEVSNSSNTTNLTTTAKTTTTTTSIETTTEPSIPWILEESCMVAGDSLHKVMIANPEECDRFVWCWKGRAYEIQCKNGFKFDKETKKCSTEITC
ncbi:Oidioi.mRNA.OKI2018_I69.PAR.g10760.t1.cds [Oikopleura dioica]|uniref:chitinase n=1 Tax=Oikopleura dioica TaxID=34765 RepID=A0ABN7RS79_OIKDI|nr:Oidioi.mRNA.OKI2018_I69.PAR.g10760.t1.cds [Oikopleura dioica]